jgi:hypothetical protein
MSIKSLTSRALAVVAIAMVVFAVVAVSDEGAVDSDELALAVADAQKANQAAITQYSWEVKTSLAKDGEEMATSINEMRFNTEGKLESTNVGGESHVEKKRGFRGRRQKAKMEDMGEYLQKVMDLSSKYIFMSKGTLVDVFDRATIKQGEKSIDITAGNLFVDGDKLFMSVDPTTKLAHQLTFSTKLDEDAINGVVKMDQMEDGPNKPAHVEIEVPSQAIKLTSETYNWIEQK